MKLIKTRANNFIIRGHVFVFENNTYWIERDIGIY